VWKTHKTPDKVGAFQNIEKGLETNVSCACHWTVNVAASKGHGKLYADAYSVAPAAVFVPPESEIRKPRISRACRSRSASSPAATTPPSRRWSST